MVEPTTTRSDGDIAIIYELVDGVQFGRKDVFVEFIRVHDGNDDGVELAQGPALPVSPHSFLLFSHLN